MYMVSAVPGSTRGETPDLVNAYRLNVPFPLFHSVTISPRSMGTLAGKNSGSTVSGCSESCKSEMMITGI